MPSAPAAIDSFLRGIEAAPPLWRSIHLRTVAVRADGSWRNVVTRGRLDWRAPADVPRVPALHARGALGAWEAVLPADALADLLDTLVEGELMIGGVRVLCWRDADGASPDPHAHAEHDERHESASTDDIAEPREGAEGGPYEGSHRFVDASRDPFGTRSGWSEHALDLAGGPVSALLGGVSPRQLGLDRALAALRRPRGDLAGWTRLMQDALAPGSTRAATLDLVAPFEARLDAGASLFADGCAPLGLVAPSPEILSFVSVDLVPASREGEGEPVRVGCGADAWVRDGAGLMLRLPPSLPGADEVEATLRVGGVRVDSRVLRDGSRGGRSTRVSAYAAFDPRLEALRSALFPLFPSQAADFDVAVLRLLGLAGLHVDLAPGPRRLGGAGTGAALAFAGEPEAVLAVDCSAGSVGGEGRLERLRDRAAQVSRALGRPAMPVIFTALDRSRLSTSERERAASHGIAVVGREELERLLRMCLDAEPVCEVVAYLASYATPAAGAEWSARDYPGEPDDEQVPLAL
ncbi:MAG: hypothetical protein JWM27_597 [Gemmatimonadetes bacterium]|nr:hypothetical protein [Gemmatimonadota bacterium]